MGGFLGTIERVVDGDTIIVSIDLMPILGVEGEVKHNVRLLGINAMEHNTTQGKAAKDWLTQLATGKQCLISIAHPDKYGGRVDADVWLSGDSETLSQRLIDSGNAISWDGKGQKPILNA